MAGDLVDETLQALASLLDKRVLEQAVVAAERELALPSFAGKRRNDNLKGKISQWSRMFRLCWNIVISECHKDSLAEIGAIQNNPPTLLSRSSSLRSHSKSLYLRSTRDSFTLKTGRLVCGGKINRKHLD